MKQELQHLTRAGHVYSLMPESTDIDTVLGHYRLFEEARDYPRELRVIIDCRNTSIGFHMRDFKRIFERIERCLEHYTFITEAILVAKPHETAMAKLFEHRVEFPNYAVRVFSTEEAAREWLTLMGQ